MIRRRQVLPDESGIVTRDALLEAMVSAADFLDFAGGALSIVTQREPTGLPGEMVTVGAIIEWRHSTGVQPGPNQFEKPTPTPKPQFERDRVFDTRTGEEFTVTAESGVAMSNPLEPPSQSPEGVEAASEEPDGFDYSKLEEEDVDEPVAAR